VGHYDGVLARELGDRERGPRDRGVLLSERRATGRSERVTAEGDHELHRSARAR
jgi:hypothetical protein